MNDCLPEQSPVWQKVEQILRQVVASYGYSEVRMPIVEQTHLFKRAIGEVTDVVEKEMYTFEDRNGDSLSLRPEGTASCVRAGIEHGLLYNQERRMWYMGPMFRHERPQKGRYRQFHQFGVELFGINGPDIDAELIMLTHRLWRLFGISDHVTLQLNTLGQSSERAAYRDALVAYLEQYKSELDEESQRRMYSNPLRVLDSKDEKVQAILAGAPRLFDHLGEESLAHFEGLKRLLTAAGIQFEVNERLVRGLDYYNLTVFEWVTTDLGAQGTICAGGSLGAMIPPSIVLIMYGLVTETSVKALFTASFLPGFMLAPISGMLMGAATASATAGTTLASQIFGPTVVASGVTPLAAAAMTHASCFVFDGLPHGSFFHVSAGGVNMEISERLKLLGYEAINGLAMMAVSTLVFGVLKLAG